MKVFNGKKIEKQSLINAFEDALGMSKKHPEVTYYILDKPRCRAQALSVDWVIKQQLIYGDWQPIAKVNDGNITYDLTAKDLVSLF